MNSNTDPDFSEGQTSANQRLNQTPQDPRYGPNIIERETPATQNMKVQTG